MIYQKNKQMIWLNNGMNLQTIFINLMQQQTISLIELIN